MPDTQKSVAVALLYASGGGDAHLRDALQEHGAVVVYEAMSANIDRDALEDSGASVVIVNLGNDSDDYIDQVHDVLETGDYEVVFNDAEVSQQLSGWDHARWARNLAAKITHQPGMSEPPRPQGAPVVSATPGIVGVDAPDSSTAAHSDDLAGSSPAPRGEEANSQGPSATVPEEPETVVLQADESGLRAETATDAASEELDLADLGAFAIGPDEVDSSPPDSLAETEKPVPAGQPSGNRLEDELENLFTSADLTLEAGDGSIAETPDSGNVAQERNPGATVPDAFNLVDDQESDQISIDAESWADSGQEPVSQNMLEDDEQERLDRSADVQNLKSLYSPEWDLEPIDEDAPAPPPPKANPDPFGIKKISASEYLDPANENAGTQRTLASKASGGLELMSMEEAIRPKQTDDEPSVDDGNTAAYTVGGMPIERVCVLGSSIGGPEAVREFLAAIPEGFPVLFILAQHMGEEFLELMSTQLRRSIALTVRVPTHGERVAHGDVLVVPTTHRLKVDREGVVTFEKLWEKPQNGPSIDEVLRDVADEFGSAAVAIIFSGMVNDAVEGCRYLKSKGGKVWVQDPKTCVVSTMVEGVQKTGLPEFAGSPAQLAQHLIAEFA